MKITSNKIIFYVMGGAILLFSIIIATYMANMFYDWLSNKKLIRYVLRYDILITAISVLVGIWVFGCYVFSAFTTMENHLQYKLADKYIRMLLPFRGGELVKVLCLLTGNFIDERERKFLISMLGENRNSGNKFVPTIIEDLDTTIISGMSRRLENNNILSVVDLNLMMQNELDTFSDSERRFLIGLRNNWEKYNNSESMANAGAIHEG